MNTIVKTFACAAMAVPLLAFAANASAQYYGGIHFDPAKTVASQSDIAPPFFVLGTATPTASLGEKKTNYGLKVGYQFAPLFAVESNYQEFGKSSPSTSSVPTNLKAKSYGLDLVGVAPIFDKFSLLGRIGVRRLNTDGAFASSSIDTFGANTAQASTAGRLNVGLQYAVTKNLGLNLEVERFRRLGNNALSSAFDADNYSVGLLFKF